MFLLQKMPSGFMDKIHRVERLRRADECVRRYTTRGKRPDAKKVRPKKFSLLFLSRVVSAVD
jgi:hypothetical protein